jgi:hypothetical protein
MSASPTPTRRNVLASTAAASALTLLGERATAGDAPSSQHFKGESHMDTKAAAIRPFHFEASQAELVDLRKRVTATRWPDKEQVADATQGVQLATVRQLSEH